jgi:maltose/moltooligosaccharide transporter
MSKDTFRAVRAKRWWVVLSFRCVALLMRGVVTGRTVVAARSYALERTGHRRNKIMYGFGSIANGVYSAFNHAILSLYVSSFTGNPFILGYLSNTQTMEGAVIQPLVGRRSDGMTSRFGRRRPFILVCVPISVAILMLIPIAGRQSRGLALPLVAAAIILFPITWNMASDPNTALMVDITTAEERPTYNAILAMLGLFVQAGVALFTSFVALKKNTIPASVFYICGALLLFSYGMVFFGVREPHAAREQAKTEASIPLRVYLSELRRFREAFKFMASMFCLWTGLNPIIPFITLYPKKVVGASNAQGIIVSANRAPAYRWSR